ncbi:MAG: DegT/DnrJ/EryC1/StrS family aminotransferase [Actinomycetota bacterium]|nr:DegT/DnrJ/EryC1/StrS family aminotransferase [Actinomycetota bacterium]
MGQVPLVRFRDLSIPDDERLELLEAIDQLMRRGTFILGADVEAFEQEFARQCRRAECVGISNGTGGLYLALRALGVGPGDEVVTSAMSWVATANAIIALGATPVFADVADDFNIDPASVERVITSRTKAILPVHYYGKMARMHELMAIAARHGLKVVEDASQAFGADLAGRPAGAFGDAAAFSLNPMKPLAALGEAGAVVLDDPEVADHIRSMRYLGTINRETCVDPSLNFKIDTIQAVILLSRMKRAEQVVAYRNHIARLYCEGLDGVVNVPLPPSDGTCAYFDYTIVCQDRDRLEQALLAEGIEVKVRHRLLLTQQPGYPKTAGPPVPNAERLVAGILSLPIHEKLTADDVMIVVDAVRRFYGA